MDKTLAEAIENDLFNELKYLLCAATEWDAQQKLVAEPTQVQTISEPCCHLKVYTMDSAFTHVRSLYEFFTMEKADVLRHKRGNHNRLTWFDYSPNPSVRQTSNKYDQSIGDLHGRVMHLSQNRSGYDEIKNEVVNFATDILDVWDRFSKSPELKDYASLLDTFRERAIEEAEAVANQYAAHGFKCPFSKTTP